MLAKSILEGNKAADRMKRDMFYFFELLVYDLFLFLLAHSLSLFNSDKIVLL